jgi:uncharacterized protein (DUF427 family)
VSLTSGCGPLSSNPAGRLNFDAPDYVMYVEPLGRRVRAFKQGQTVVDSDDALMVYESDKSARYLLPGKDVHISSEPFAGMDGYVTVAWNQADAWFEEDERIFGHPINPYHRIDTYRTSRRIEVSVQGLALASSTRARALYETGLAVRYYLPLADVNRSALIPSETVTECAYKGAARYWSAQVGDVLIDDVAWMYENNVLRDAAPIQGLIAFYNEKVELRVDGSRLN